jgi:GTP-binding protein
MKFVDEVSIEVQAGKGGAGSRHFRREKYVPLGGPDGGNGGDGGSVVVVADENKHTLLDFHYQPRWQADAGSKGDGARKDGKHGEDCIIKVPVGTEIIDPTSGELIADLNANGASVVIAKGGKGGKGNAFFKSPTNRAPDYAQPGLPGEQGAFTLSLKLVADVGLVGFPNAGKSTLISRLSEARPKIADYPFTTLVPNLGVAKLPGGDSFVIADIPGLIPGAHQGKGLGIQFLKHVERTRIILHLIDPTQLNEQGETISLVDSYLAIRHELEQFSSDLETKREVIVLTKSDAWEEEQLADDLKYFQSHELPVLRISAVTGDGLTELLETIRKSLRPSMTIGNETHLDDF